MGPRGQSFHRAGLPSEEIRKEAASCLAEGWEAWKLQIKGGLCAYSGFSFLGKTWPRVNGVFVKEGAGIRPQGFLRGRVLKHFLSPPLQVPACWKVGAQSQRHLNPHPVSQGALLAPLARGEK